jgi:hypothetical protein
VRIGTKLGLGFGWGWSYIPRQFFGWKNPKKLIHLPLWDYL